MTNTTFVEINTSEDHDFVITYFVPANESEFRESADLSLPVSPYSLVHFDQTIAFNKSGTCRSDNMTAVLNTLGKFEGNLEIVSVGLKPGTVRGIKKALAIHSIRCKWLEPGELDAMKIHYTCTKLRITFIKTNAQCSIRELLDQLGPV